MIRFLTALAFLLFAVPAFAQQPMPIGGGSANSPCYFPAFSSSCTFPLSVSVTGSGWVSGSGLNGLSIALIPNGDNTLELRIGSYVARVPDHVTYGTDCVGPNTFAMMTAAG